MKPKTGLEPAGSEQPQRALARGQSFAILPKTRVARGVVRVETLINLLEDDSEVVLSGVRKELLRLGRVARPALQNAVRNGPAAVRVRARRILMEAGRARALGRLLGYAARSEHELESALWLLERHGSPGADIAPYRKVLDAFGDEVARRLRGKVSAVERAETLVQYLAEERGFRGPSADYHHSGNIYLARAIERRSGIPLTLCAVYAAVAKRAGLEAGLLPLPGHVLLSVRTGGERVTIDPFGGGTRLSEKECLRYLAQHGLPYKSEWFREANATAIFARQIRNLMHSFSAVGRASDARALGRVLAVLERRPSVS